MPTAPVACHLQISLAGIQAQHKGILPVLACEGVRQEPPHRQASQADVGEAKGHLGGRETHDHEQIREQRADSEDSRASSVDFDVTLLLKSPCRSSRGHRCMKPIKRRALLY